MAWRPQRSVARIWANTSHPRQDWQHVVSFSVLVFAGDHPPKSPARPGAVARTRRSEQLRGAGVGESGRRSDWQDGAKPLARSEPRSPVPAPQAMGREISVPWPATARTGGAAAWRQAVLAGTAAGRRAAAGRAAGRARPPGHAAEPCRGRRAGESSGQYRQAPAGAARTGATTAAARSRPGGISRRAGKAPAWRPFGVPAVRVQGGRWRPIGRVAVRCHGRKRRPALVPLPVARPQWLRPRGNRVELRRRLPRHGCFPPLGFSPRATLPDRSTP
jgi:hypothetical protein